MSAAVRPEITSAAASLSPATGVDQMQKRHARDHPGMTSAVIRTLRRAADTLGGEQPLAEALVVPLDQLEEWLKGKGLPMNAVYLTALDIVAQGPLWKPAQSKRSQAT